MGKPTVRDIAKMTGMSPASVSRALKGGPGVNKENRQRIRSAAQELGYVYEDNPVRQASGSLIAILVRDIQNPFYAELIENAVTRLNSFEYQSIIIPSVHDYKKVLSRLSDLPVQGLVLLESLNDPITYLDEIDRLHCPAVLLLNRPVESFGGSSVIQDNFQAGYTATRYLIELGHRRIGFLSGPRSAPALNDRISGYRMALENYGISLEQSFIFSGDLTSQSGRELAVQLCQSESCCLDALICANDLMAIGFMDEFRKRGRKIPEDLSLMGFDDISMASFFGIDLTTMRQNAASMGRQTAELLHRRIIDPKSPVENIVVDPEIIIRKTTAQKHRLQTAAQAIERSE